MCDVLVIEDDALIRTLVAEILRESGWNVAEAGSIAEARAVLADIADTCRVLVVDNDLKEHGSPGGFDFARQWIAQSPACSALYVSGGSQSYERIAPPGERERCLPKPFRSADLVGSVQELVADTVRTISSRRIGGYNLTC